MIPAFFTLALLAAVSPPDPGAISSGGAVYSSHLMVDQEVLVSSRITGIIETISVDRGTSVVKGQTLAILDQREAESEVRQAKEDMELRRAEFERARTLSGLKLASSADLDTARARFAVATATLDKAKTLRDYAVIRAPFTGIVTEKSARIGQKVVDVQNIPLFKITAFEPLLARIYLPEKELMSVRRNETVQVVPTSFPEARTTGTIEFISPTVDAASGTFQVLIRVRRDPARNVLRPGLAVQVRLPAGPNR